MRHCYLLVFAFVLGVSSIGFGQLVTTIAAIQDTTGTGSATTPLLDSVVTIEGTISAERWAFNGRYFIQDGKGPWSGILVYGDWDRENAYGDSIRITATVGEYNDLTQLTDVTEYTKLDSGKTVEPTVVTSGEIGTGGSMTEAYEGVLVRVHNAAITNPDLGYGEWEINDGSGACVVDDYADYYFIQANYDSVKSITGVMDYSYGSAKIWPRLAWDIVEGGEFTRIQRIQQVRYSDLLKTPIDEMSDMSYAADLSNPGAGSYRGDTLKIRGVVTYPTALGYAGAGRKMILSEIGGGPWSSILSYHPDSTRFPVLFEGDEVEFYGDVGEYRTGPSNMTEFWILDDPVITAFGSPVPDPDLVNTGDLRLPVTAEQWGNCLIYLKNAKVVDLLEGGYELFAVDDGTGIALIDDDSDAMGGYEDPPLGSIADSIRGWVYHHYGSYSDSNTHVIEPLYPRDIVWGGGGPPTLSNVKRDFGIPTSADVVTVSGDVATDLTITDASLYYRVDGGEYTTLSMINTTGDTYEAQIPAQALGSWVDYCIVMTDDQAQTAMAPTDTSVQNLCYPVTDGSLGISDLQYTTWELAETPFEGVNLEITGVVTADTLNLNDYVYFPIQDADGPWNGMYVYGGDPAESPVVTGLLYGDEVKVYGTVTDHNSEWLYMFENNTVILADSFEVLSTGNTVNSVTVASADLNGESESVESYEGTLVKIENATLTAINSYDVTFDDGSGPCLVDDDVALPGFFVNSDEGYLYAFGDTLRPGDKVSMVQGCFVFSFGTYKIEVGKAADFGALVGIDPDFKQIPLSYRLQQNFPNPFNPETRIYFELPQQQDVTLVIYNMLGQIVRTLVNNPFNAGSHTVNWDGRDNGGNLVSTGVYIYRIKAGEFIASKKMLLMK